MESKNVVDVNYHRTGKSTNTNELGMREMQARVYQHRSSQYILVKAPPASGKSRALMFVALISWLIKVFERLLLLYQSVRLGSLSNTPS